MDGHSGANVSVVPIVFFKWQKPDPSAVSIIFHTVNNRGTMLDPLDDVAIILSRC